LYPQAAGAKPEAMLQNIGVSQPEQGRTDAEPRIILPTRVNVANRYLGNKACKYETMKDNKIRQKMRLGEADGRGNQR